MEFIAQDALNQLSGVDYWIALGGLLVIVAGIYVCEVLTWTKLKTRICEIVWTACVIALVVGIILFRQWRARQEATFNQSAAGILVLQIVGDDGTHSLQRDLVRSLNAEIANRFPSDLIAVHAYPESVDESLGWSKAHDDARKIGQKCRAQVVVWGDAIGSKKFHPRITVVSESSGSALFSNNRALDLVSNVTEMRLPAQLVTAMISGLPQLA